MAVNCRARPDPEVDEFKLRMNILTAYLLFLPDSFSKHIGGIVAEHKINIIFFYWFTGFEMGL